MSTFLRQWLFLSSKTLLTSDAQPLSFLQTELRSKCSSAGSDSKGRRTADNKGLANFVLPSVSKLIQSCTALKTSSSEVMCSSDDESIFLTRRTFSCKKFSVSITLVKQRSITFKVACATTDKLKTHASLRYRVTFFKLLLSSK